MDEQGQDPNGTGPTSRAAARPSRISIEGPGGSVVAEGPPGGGSPLRPRGVGESSWDDLGRIHEVDDLGDDDQDVLAEINDVLIRHGAQHRLGITLLHSHFDLGDGEVLVARVDDEARTMSITTESSDAFEPAELLPTAWRFVDDRLVPLQYCHRPKDSVFHMR